MIESLYQNWPRPLKWLRGRSLTDFKISLFIFAFLTAISVLNATGVIHF